MKRSSCEEHDPVNAKYHRHLSEGHMMSAYSEVDRNECHGGGCQRGDPDNRLLIQLIHLRLDLINFGNIKVCFIIIVPT